MEGVLFNLMEITLSVSILIGLLLIFSPLLRKKYTVKWRYWIWMILAIRLIIPFNITLPEAPLKIPVPPVMTQALVEQDRLADQETISQGQGGQAGAAVPVEQLTTGKKEDAAKGLWLSWQQAVMAVWLLGAGGFLIYQIAGYRLFCRRIKPWFRALKEETAEGQEIFGIYRQSCRELSMEKALSAVPILYCKKIKSPMVVGFFKRRLLLPERGFSVEQTEMILRHELVHIKRGDIYYKALLLLARAVHWFNPLVHKMAREACKDLEQACDGAVVCGREADYRQAYSAAVLAVMERSGPSQAVFSTSFGGGKEAMKKRFENIFDGGKKKRGIPVFLAALLLLAVLGVCIGCGGPAPVTYENEQLGISLEFPAEWKDKFVVLDETEDSFVVYHKEIHQAYPGMGRFFSVQRKTGELITEAGLGVGPPSWVIAQGNGWTYVIYAASDVNYPAGQDEALSADYIAMQQHSGEIEGKVIGDARPSAENPGFRVIGTNYFTADIPEDWSIEVAEDTELAWVLKEGKDPVGKIALAPLTDGILSAGAGPANYADPYDSTKGILWQPHTDSRAAGIYLYESADVAETGQKIADTFQFTEGIYNKFDSQSIALEYIRRGGERIFGKIQGFTYETNPDTGENQMAGIQFRKFDLKSDSRASGGQYGKDLNEMVVYPLNPNMQGHVEVLPLMPPDFATHPDYETIFLEDFALDFDKKIEGADAAYGDLYYDLIVVYGAVMMVQGHPVEGI